MHVFSQPFSAHSHIIRVEGAFLLALSKRRVCCAAAQGPEHAAMLQWAAANKPQPFTCSPPDWGTALISPPISSPPRFTSASQRGHATHLFLLSLFFFYKFPSGGDPRALGDLGAQLRALPEPARGPWGRTEQRPGALRRQPRGWSPPCPQGSRSPGSGRVRRPRRAALRGARWLPSGRCSGTAETCGAATRGGAHSAAARPSPPTHTHTDKLACREPCGLRAPLRLQGDTRSPWPGSRNERGPQEQAGEAGAAPRPGQTQLCYRKEVGRGEEHFPAAKHLSSPTKLD